MILTRRLTLKIGTAFATALYLWFCIRIPITMITSIITSNERLAVFSGPTIVPARHVLRVMLGGVSFNVSVFCSDVKRPTTGRPPSVSVAMTLDCCGQRSVSCRSLAQCQLHHSAKNLANHFTLKVDNVRQSTFCNSPPVISKCNSNTVSTLHSVTVEEAARLSTRSPAKQCPLYSVPPWLLKRAAEQFARIIPLSQKHALVTRLGFKTCLSNTKTKTKTCLSKTWFWISKSWSSRSRPRPRLSSFKTKTKTKTLMSKTKTETQVLQDQYWKSITVMDCDKQKD